MNGIDIQTLGRINLIQSTLHVMQDNEAIARFICRGLSRIPSIQSAAMLLGDSHLFENADLTLTENDISMLAACLSTDPEIRRKSEIFLKSWEETHEIFCLHIRTAFRLYGFLLINAPRKEIFADVRPYIENTLNLVALVIENNLQKKLLEQQNEELEKQVWVRTEQLEKTVDKLRAEIRERQAAEQTLTHFEQKWKNVLINTPQIGISLNPEGKIVFANAHFLELTGYSEEEVLGRDWFERFIPAGIREQIRKVFHTVMSRRNTQGFSQFENELMLRNGEVRNIAWFNVLTWDSKGLPMDVTCLGVDLTERKQAEEERQRLQEQLLQAQKLESIGRLAGGVAHDFNNMLQSIIGYSEIGLEQIHSDHPLHSCLTQIQHAAHRSAELTKQLLAFARKQPIQPRILDLNQTISTMVQMLQRIIGAHITLIWIPGTDLWPIRIDPSQIDQVLANLCVNARDAIHGPGSITIETKNMVVTEPDCRDIPDIPSGEYVRITVTDTGGGMEPALLPRIFEPFFTTKELGKGTGLGLSTVYGIIRQNGGTIVVSSQPEKGTEFRIYLPRSREAIDNSAPAESPVKNTGSETILLVEDDPSILKLGKDILQHLGYRVLAAPSPGEAINTARSYDGPIDLLITDIIMPEINGLAMAEQLKELRPGLRAIFMSGYYSNSHSAAPHPNQDRAFLAKPFSFKTLSQKVREILDSQAS